MKKKVAILYGGLSQGRLFPICFETQKKYLIDPNKDNYDFDIFIHHWEDDGNLKNWCPWYKNKSKTNFEINKDYIFNIIKPKKYLFETQINVSDKKYSKFIGEGFKTYGGKNKHPIWYNLMRSEKLGITYNFTSVSMFLSYYKCKNLMLEYENENNFKYDIIILFRPEYFLFKKINLDNYNLSILNVHHYHYYNKILLLNNILNEKNKMNGKKNYLPRIFINLFTVTNRCNAIYLLNFFENIKKYNYSNKKIQKFVNYKIDNNITYLVCQNIAFYLKNKKIKVKQCILKSLIGGTYRNNDDVSLYYYHIPPYLYKMNFNKKLTYTEILKIEKKNKHLVNNIKEYYNFWDYEKHNVIVPIDNPITIQGESIKQNKN